MTNQLGLSTWPQVTPPTADRCWTWAPGDLRDLPRVRQEFRARVSALHPGHSLAHGNHLEDAIAVLDELMSNALRHGRAPVVVEVCRSGDDLLLMVGDHAVEEPPQPTAIRDPALGGMGLGIIAHTSLAHRWTSRADVKTVWALMLT